MKKIIPTLILTTIAGVQGNAAVDPNFNYHVDRFADIEVLRYEVPEFDRLIPAQRIMLYYLSQAAQMGRDIIWDQNGKYNLQIRQLLEKIYTGYTGDRESKDFKAFETYMKQAWFGNGIHHHYSTDKFTPGFSKDFFLAEVSKISPSELPLAAGETPEQMTAKLTEVIFNPAVMAKRVNQDGTQDVVATSAGNYYGEGVTQAEVEDFYNAMKDPSDATPVSYGLNSKVIKDADGNLKEEVYSLNGLYGPAISQIIYWLDKAKSVAENDAQKAHITALIDYYITGDLRTFDEYSILWAEDTQSDVDFV
ncbi:MAG: dipeptidyl peptidase 3, partial [Muribaculaceae bacterium]|nr:dipeptidyl peptidase 3 [Muribaculaceae bacterium]